MDRNYNEALTALIKALPDGGVVFNFLTGIDNAGFFQALAKLEYKLFTVVSFFAYEEDLKSTGSVYMEGSFCVASFSNSAGDQPFKASVVAASAGTLSAGEVSERAYDAYLAVKLWAMSVRRAGSFSSELMSKLNDISVASPTGNRLHVTSSHQVSKTIVMLKVTGGALVPVAQTMTPSWPASNECKFSTYSSCALSTDDVSTTQALAEGACVPFASVSARGGCVCGAGRMCTSAGLCVRRGRGCGQSLSPGDFCKYYGAMTVNGSCVCKDALVCDQGHCKINDSSRSAIVSFLVSGVPRSTLYSYGVPTRFALSLVEGLTTRLTSDLSTTAELRRICDVRRNRTFDCVHAGELSPDNVHSGVLPASFLPVGDTDVLFGRYSIQFEFHLWPSGDHAHDVARQFVARFASGTVLEGLAETSLTVIHSSSYVKSSFGFRSLFI
ncbi:hypothetical protein DIPPA_50731 [Diplonema papillatum]|nr:hypothetical protein DIPPA_50731 [Diplonema papillatum]